MLTAILLLGVASCGDEPSGIHHGNRVDPTPEDTTHHSDTTGSHGNDTTGGSANDTTTTPFTLAIDADRDYGYMGQTLQLHAATTTPSPVSWRSTRMTSAIVDGDGLVTFNNVIADDSTLIIATAAGVSDTIFLTNRCWNVATWNGTAWLTPALLTVHRGDTIVLTIIDSHGMAIDDNGFNAAACQWSIVCRNADVAAIARLIATPSQANGWKQQWVILDDAPAGAVFTLIAAYHEAAATLSCTITP